MSQVHAKGLILVEGLRVVFVPFRMTRFYLSTLDTRTRLLFHSSKVSKFCLRSWQETNFLRSARSWIVQDIERMLEKIMLNKEIS